MPVLHYAQATMAAGAAGAALLERAKSGLGQAVTVSGLSAVALVGGASGNILPIGRRPLGASPSYRLYECGDGQFLFLATLFSYFFQRAVRAMGLEVALAEDVFPEDVTALMEARFRQKTPRRVAGDHAGRRRAGRAGDAARGMAAQRADRQQRHARGGRAP